MANHFFNLADYFVDRHLREGRGDKVAILCGESVLTYADVAAQTNRAGNGLRRLGVEEEQRVLLLLPDGPEFVAAYFGAMKIGAVAVPANPMLRESDYAYFLEETRARVLFVHSSAYPEISGLLGSQKYLRAVIVVGDPQLGSLHWEHWDDWLAASSPELDAAATSGDDVAFWLWTSGSTGRSKAAVHLHRDWLHCCENYNAPILGIGPDDIIFASSKLFHAYGLGNGLIVPFHAGASTVLFSARPRAKAILETIQRFRPTIFFSVPTLYARMFEEAEAEAEAEQNHYTIDSVRRAVSAAEPLPAGIFHAWKRRFGIEILDGIGSTEVLHIYISARAGQVRPGSTGTVVPGYRVRIVDEAGNDAPRGTVGDLLVAGKSTAPCYWNQRDLSADRMRGHWFFTGDKYWQDEDGYYWYAGRSDDMFRVSGQWVSPLEVENALIEHACVREAAVIALTEANELHTTMAFVVLREGFAATPGLTEELQAFVKSRITPYKYPRRIEFVSALPRSAAGKLLRYKLRELATPSATSVP